MKLTTPAAIVLAGGLVGIGLFAGLRTRPSDVTVPPPAPTIVPRETVTQQAQAAIAAHHDELMRACDAARLKGEHAKLRFDYTFAPDGRQLARGVLVEAASQRLLNCIQVALPVISVPPPGASTRVEVGFEF